VPEGLTADALKRAVESILFVAEGAVDLKTLARLTEADEGDVLAAIEILTEESARRGVRIQRSGEAAQMVSAPENTTYIQRFLGIDENARLSPAVLATLTVIAYRQPITRGEIERILNKNADYGVQTLKLRGLITEVGRASSAGRPYLYGTTFKFLEHFGLEKPEDLPSLPELESAVREAAAAEAEAMPPESTDEDSGDEPDSDED
jgi:segregation and condensation protein B